MNDIATIDTNIEIATETAANAAACIYGLDGIGSDWQDIPEDTRDSIITQWSETIEAVISDSQADFAAGETTRQDLAMTIAERLISDLAKRGDGFAAALSTPQLRAIPEALVAGSALTGLASL